MQKTQNVMRTFRILVREPVYETAPKWVRCLGVCLYDGGRLWGKFGEPGSDGRWRP